MLIGNADAAALAEQAPTLESFATEAVRLEGVQTLQVLYEIESRGMEALLPPSLHPTLPPAVTWLVQRVDQSPWGPFGLAQLRIECRSGLRPRGFLRMGVIDNAAAAAALSAGWGYTLREGSVAVDRCYDRVAASVAVEGCEIVALALSRPEPLRPADLFYVASMNLAHTPRGLRLLQVDPEYETERVERGRPSVDGFDAAAWASEGVRPSYPVSASFSVGTMVLPALRYACRTDVLAFEGTERVDATEQDGGR